MSYSQEVFGKVREEFSMKRLQKEDEARIRREKWHLLLPELKEVDDELVLTGSAIMKASLQYDGNRLQEEVEKIKKENQRLQEKRKNILLSNKVDPAELKPKYDCEICQDTGYDGIYMCRCMKKRLAEETLHSCGMAHLLEKQRFDNFSLDYYRDASIREYMSAMLRYLKNYAEDFSAKSESLILMGGTGLGKTHLASALAKAVIERGFDVAYNSAIGIAGEFEARRFGKSITETGKGNPERYTECELLMIDDLGAEIANGFTTGCMLYVINRRLDNDLPTIITTNLESSSEMERIYGNRMASRLSSYRILAFRGNDIRKQISMEKSK